MKLTRPIWFLPMWVLRKMISPANIDTLLTSGCSAEQVLAMVRAELVVQQEELLARRASTRERVRNHRKNKDEQNQQPCNGYNLLQPVTEIASIREGKEVSKQEKEVSNRRVSKKRSKIPLDLLCSERNRADGIKIGLLEPDIAIEWPKFHDHHLHKGTLGLDWDAGWRRWCQNFISWKGTKNGTQGNVIQAADRLLANIRAFNAGDQTHQPGIRSGESQIAFRLLSKG